LQLTEANALCRFQRLCTVTPLNVGFIVADYLEPERRRVEGTGGPAKPESR